MNGFVFRVYTHDHPPPHVHVRISGTYARIAVGPEGAAPYVMPGRNMRGQDLARALAIARDWQAHLLSEWGRYHDGSS